jgi:hypothetical protein
MDELSRTILSPNHAVAHREEQICQRITDVSVCNFINPVAGTIIIVLVGYYSIKHHRNRTIKDELEIEKLRERGHKKRGDSF